MPNGYLAGRLLEQKVGVLGSIASLLTHRHDHSFYARRLVNAVDTARNRFAGAANEGPYYAPSMSFALPLHTNYTPELVHYALWALGKMYRSGYRYMKCGVMLTDLIPEGAETGDLFARRDTARQSKLKGAMDHINQAMGRRTLFYASSGIQQGWTGASARKSPAYTTDWDSLIHVKAT